MINGQIISIVVVFLTVMAALTTNVQLANGQEQMELQDSIQIEGIIDELLSVHPVLSELAQENETGVVDYLNSLETQEAVHTLLALKTLQDLIELHSSHMMAEAPANQTALANQTAS